jgi:endonuclease/exonuclease/phosphatase family metal-dependent hydrolase
MSGLGRLSVVAAFLLYLSPGTPASAVPVDLTVMSQNLYIGANTDALLTAPDPTTAATAFASVVANNFPKRADAIATEAASAGGPLLIGLQEAYILSAPTGPTLNYAQILLNQLTAKGLHYTIAGVHTGFNLAAGGYSVTEREVVLARTDAAGFTVTGSEDHTFKTNFPLGSLSLDRGYVLVDATLDGIPFQFVSTHLDSHKAIQEAQADEIVAALKTTAEPQLVVGDFNATSTDAAYRAMVAAGFIDPGAAVGAAGPTCCQAPDLDNPVSQLTDRIDYVFERGFSSVDSALIVGNTPFETLRPLWPSDHAGVIAAVDLPEPAAEALFAAAMLLLGILRFRAQSSLRG